MKSNTRIHTIEQEATPETSKTSLNEFHNQNTARNFFQCSDIQLIMRLSQESGIVTAEQILRWPIAQPRLKKKRALSGTRGCAGPLRNPAWKMRATQGQVKIESAKRPLRDNEIITMQLQTRFWHFIDICSDPRPAAQ